MTSSLIGQSINTPFGKNRVQYHDDFNDWWMYETENFITHWYGKAKNIAISTIQMAELDHDEIQNLMEHRFNDKIEIIVYLDVTDLKQSNIGLEDAFINRPKETKIEGNKMFVYFNGNHADLQLQIRRGIAAIYLQSILVGVNLQEIVQNAVLLNLPEWYKVGLIEYVGSYWNIDADDELRELFSQKDGKYFDFKKLAIDYPKIAGHSFWYYMDQNYGKSSISNILYLTKINRNLESSFVYVLSQEYEEVIVEWETFFRKKYGKEDGVFEPLSESKIETKGNADYPLSMCRFNPEGNKLAYVKNELGKAKVFIRDLSKETDQLIFKKGHKNIFQETDYQYPQVAWNPNGLQIAILYELRDQLMLRKYYLADGSYEEKIIPEQIDRVYSISYLNAKDFVFSASDDGFSDLYQFTWKTRQFENLTQDYHDDLDATVAYLDGEKGVFFSSTRQSNSIEVEKLDTILPLDKYDLFFLPLGAKTCKRLTFTVDVNERYPYPCGNNTLSFIGDASGVRNIYIKALDKDDNGYPITNFDRNVIRHHSVMGSGLLAWTLYREGGYASYLNVFELDSRASPFVTDHRKESNPSKEMPLVLQEAGNAEPLKEEYKFQTRFDDPTELEVIAGKEDKTSFFDLNLLQDDNDKSYKDVDKYINARAIASRLRFKLVDFATDFNNDVLFEGLESYVGDDKQLVNQPLAVSFKAVVRDLFDDYDLEAGSRYPTSLNGSEYYLLFENNKKLIDKSFALYRKSKSVNQENSVFPSRFDKRVSFLGLSTFKYPFDIYRSVRLTGTLRFDRLFPKVTEELELQRPFEEERRIGVRTEYIFDNTLRKDINILNGMRYKIYAEAINKFKLDIIDGFEFDGSTGFTTVVGADFRKYFPIGKWSTLAVRLAGATSFGSNKMMYYLGGMEGGLFANFNDNIPIPNGDDFAFKALAPYLRGFDHNIRNGSTFVLSNTELRLPVVRMLLGDLKNNFLRNLILTTFLDVGTAWHGASPYSDENPLNIVEVENSSVSVTANYFRDPFVFGYGVGLRSTLLGYYVKLDYAWGVETGEVQKPKLHLSLGMDF